jgi:hypothetical protein
MGESIMSSLRMRRFSSLGSIWISSLVPICASFSSIEPSIGFSPWVRADMVEKDCRWETLEISVLLPRVWRKHNGVHSYTSYLPRFVTAMSDPGRELVA